MQKNTKQKANVLITVLAVLLVISTMAVSFARIAGSERLASSNYSESLKTRLLSEAGLNFGISRLRRDFQQEVMCTVQAFTDKTGELKGERRWTCTALNDENPEVLTSGNMHLVEDDMAAGIPIENLQKVNLNPIKSDTGNPQLVSPHPSYAVMDQGTDLPKPIPNTNFLVTRTQKTLPNATIPTYTLKIISLNSQIDLNSQTPQFGQAVESIHLATMLNNLSVAISKREPYRSEFPDDVGKGPLFSTIAGEGFLGQSVLALRDKMSQKRFSSKFQILELKGINKEKAVYLWDFICASPKQQVVLARPAILQNPNVATPQDPDNPPVNELEEYRTDTRAPININLAPWPVLVATFMGLECVDATGEKITITMEDAEALAARICRERRRDRRPEKLEDPTDFQYPFTEWENFKKYLLRPHDEAAKIAGALDVFSGSLSTQRKKALLVYAMADPNVHLRRTNPDEVLYQEINKTDITKPTLELSFYPYGLFEITSLGQIITIKGEVVESHKRQTVVKIFDIVKKNSQDDFNFEHVLASTDGASLANFRDINSYSSGNNVNLIDNISEEDLVDIVSHEFGHISPVNFDNKFLGPGVDSFNQDKSKSGAILFRCNFNGDNLFINGGVAEATTPYSRTLNADFPLPGENADSPEGGRIIAPSNGLTSKEASKSILPKEQDCANIALIGDLASDGVVFFENPDSQFDGSVEVVEDRTLCYLTKNNMPMPSTITGFETNGTVSFWFKCNENKDWRKFRTVFFATTPMTDDGSKGVQMEIQAKLDENANLIVQARRKFYDINESLERVTDIYVGAPETMAFIGTGAQKTFNGVQKHKWYNIAIRWQQVTLIESSDILLFGDFENESSANITFEEEDPINNTSKSLVNIPLDETLLDLDLQPNLGPIDPTEVLTKNNARMYFGTVKRTYAPGANGAFGDADDASAIFSTACTIDDIRIHETRISNSFTASRFSPTGFEHKVPGDDGVFGTLDDETLNVVGMFSGEFSGIDANRTVLGVFDWTRRVPKEFDDGSFKDQAFTQGEFDPEEFDNSNISSSTEYISVYQKQKKNAPMQIKFNGIDQDVLDAIADEVLGNDRGESVFGRPISDDEFRRLFAKDIKKVWNRFAKEANENLSKFNKIQKVEKLKDSKFFGIVFDSAQAKARRILRNHPELLNRLINLKQEIANSLANGGGTSEDEPDNGQNPVILGDGLLPFEFENILPEEEITIDRIENKAEGFIDDLTQKAFAVKAVNPLEAPLVPIAESIQADDGKAGETKTEKVIVSPENADFQYNLMFLQAKQSAEDSSVKVAFSTPIIDDVTISYQSKVIFFYNIELFE